MTHKAISRYWSLTAKMLAATLLFVTPSWSQAVLPGAKDIKMNQQATHFLDGHISVEEYCRHVVERYLVYDADFGVRNLMDNFDAEEMMSPEEKTRCRNAWRSRKAQEIDTRKEEAGEAMARLKETLRQSLALYQEALTAQANWEEARIKGSIREVTWKQYQSTRLTASTLAEKIRSFKSLLPDIRRDFESARRARIAWSFSELSLENPLQIAPAALPVDMGFDQTFVFDQEDRVRIFTYSEEDNWALELAYRLNSGPVDYPKTRYPDEESAFQTVVRLPPEPELPEPLRIGGFTAWLECTTNHGKCSDKETITIPKELREVYGICHWDFSRKSRNGPADGTGPFLVGRTGHSVTIELYARDKAHNARGWHKGTASLKAIRRDATQQQRKESQCNTELTRSAGLCYVVKKGRDALHAVDCLRKANSQSKIGVCAEEMRSIKVAECVYSTQACDSEKRAFPDSGYIKDGPRRSAACR